MREFVGLHVGDVNVLLKTHSNRDFEQSLAKPCEGRLDVGCLRLLGNVALEVDEQVKVIVLVHRPNWLRANIKEIVQPLEEVKRLR